MSHVDSSHTAGHSSKARNGIYWDELPPGRGGNGGGGVYRVSVGRTASLAKSSSPLRFSQLTRFSVTPFLACRRGDAGANVINAQMELSLLSGGLVKAFPEEGGGLGGGAQRGCGRGNKKKT